MYRSHACCQEFKPVIGDLQSKMKGSTSMHLDKAIQSLTGQEVNAKNEAKKAKKQTNHDLEMAEPQT